MDRIETYTFEDKDSKVAGSFTTQDIREAGEYARENRLRIIAPGLPVRGLGDGREPYRPRGGGMKHIVECLVDCEDEFDLGPYHTYSLGDYLGSPHEMDYKAR